MNKHYHNSYHLLNTYYWPGAELSIYACQLHEVGTIITLILQMRKFRFRKIDSIVLNSDFDYRSNRNSQKRAVKEHSLEQCLAKCGLQRLNSHGLDYRLLRIIKLKRKNKNMGTQHRTTICTCDSMWLFYFVYNCVMYEFKRPACSDSWFWLSFIQYTNKSGRTLKLLLISLRNWERGWE